MNHDYDGAAAWLNVSKSFLMKRIAQLPHRKFGDSVRFTEADLEEINEIFAVRPVRPDDEVLPVAVPQAFLDLKPQRARQRRQTQDA